MAQDARLLLPASFRASDSDAARYEELRHLCGLAKGAPPLRTKAFVELLLRLPRAQRVGALEHLILLPLDSRSRWLLAPLLEATVSGEWPSQVARLLDSADDDDALAQLVLSVLVEPLFILCFEWDASLQEADATAAKPPRLETWPSSSRRTSTSSTASSISGDPGGRHVEWNAAGCTETHSSASLLSALGGDVACLLRRALNGTCDALSLIDSRLTRRALRLTVLRCARCAAELRRDLEHAAWQRLEAVLDAIEDFVLPERILAENGVAALPRVELDGNGRLVQRLCMFLEGELRLSAQGVDEGHELLATAPTQKMRKQRRKLLKAYSSHVQFFRQVSAFFTECRSMSVEAIECDNDTTDTTMATEHSDAETELGEPPVEEDRRFQLQRRRLKRIVQKRRRERRRFAQHRSIRTELSPALKLGRMMSKLFRKQQQQGQVAGGAMKISAPLSLSSSSQWQGEEEESAWTAAFLTRETPRSVSANDIHSVLPEMPVGRRRSALPRRRTHTHMRTRSEHPVGQVVGTSTGTGTGTSVRPSGLTAGKTGHRRQRSRTLPVQALSSLFPAAAERRVSGVQMPMSDDDDSDSDEVPSMHAGRLPPRTPSTKLRALPDKTPSRSLSLRRRESAGEHAAHALCFNSSSSSEDEDHEDEDREDVACVAVTRSPSAVGVVPLVPTFS